MPKDPIKHIGDIISILSERYPDARVTLDHIDAHQLLVAAILAAQSTDANVNKITPDLFKKYPNVQAFANADSRELEQDIHSAGFFRQKTKSIIESAQDIVNMHGGKVPNTMEELTKLRGVGRKTANVILGDAYGVPGIIVDTHMLRVTARIGLVDAEFSKKKDAVKVERELMKVVPKQDWTKFSHLIVAFGRDICTARAPKHAICPIRDMCRMGQAWEASRKKH